MAACINNHFFCFLSYWDPYGPQPLSGSGPCAVTESWAFVMGHYRKKIHFSETIGENYPGTEYWFKQVFLWKLLYYNTITASELFSCMTNEVQSLYALKNKLIITYPEHSSEIDSLYNACYNE